MNASEARKLTEIASHRTQKQRPVNPIVASFSYSQSNLVPKATPSVRRHHSTNSSIVLIDDNILENVAPSEVVIGRGRFGSCSHMIYKDTFDVCVKKFNSHSSLDAIQAEASLMTTLNSGDFTPHCFGVSINMRAIIMSLITVVGRPIPFHLALNKTFGSVIDLDIQTSLKCLLRISYGLQFIHKKEILHNDLKLDNIVLGTTKSHSLKAYIVDFGKACSIQAARHYHLSEEEKDLYKAEHTQISPDLRDGLVKQRVATDVYSLGRIMKRTNQLIIKSTNLRLMIKQCLQYHSHNRPTVVEVISKLEECVSTMTF